MSVIEKCGNRLVRFPVREDVTGHMLYTLNSVDLFYQERLQLKSLIPSLDGIFVSSKKINNFVAMNEHKLTLMFLHLGKFCPVCSEFLFKCHSITTSILLVSITPPAKAL